MLVNLIQFLKSTKNRGFIKYFGRFWFSVSWNPGDIFQLFNICLFELNIDPYPVYVKEPEAKIVYLSFIRIQIGFLIINAGWQTNSEKDACI